jgi:hypothetical protein
MRRKLEKESFRPLPKVLSKSKGVPRKPFSERILEHSTWFLKRHCKPQRFRGAFILAPIVLGWVREILAERKHKYHAALRENFFYCGLSRDRDATRYERGVISICARKTR